MLHAQEAPAQEPTRLPPAWQQWRPYEPAPAPDTIALPLTPPGVRALGLVPPTRWLTVDPMADEYPAWSPYNYVLNNPLLYTDPTGKYPTCGQENNCDESYSTGSVVENSYGSWEYQGSNQWKDLSTGEAVSAASLYETFTSGFQSEFSFSQPAYLMVEGVGVHASYNVTGTVSVVQMSDEGAVLFVSASGLSAASGFGSLEWGGTVSVPVRGIAPALPCSSLQDLPSLTPLVISSVRHLYLCR